MWAERCWGCSCQENVDGKDVVKEEMQEVGARKGEARVDKS